MQYAVQCNLVQVTLCHPMKQTSNHFIAAVLVVRVFTHTLGATAMRVMKRTGYIPRRYLNSAVIVVIRAQHTQALQHNPGDMEKKHTEIKHGTGVSSRLTTATDPAHTVVRLNTLETGPPRLLPTLRLLADELLATATLP